MHESNLTNKTQNEEQVKSSLCLSNFTSNEANSWKNFIDESSKRTISRVHYSYEWFSCKVSVWRVKMYDWMKSFLFRCFNSTDLKKRTKDQHHANLKLVKNALVDMVVLWRLSKNCSKNEAKRIHCIWMLGNLIWIEATYNPQIQTWTTSRDNFQGTLWYNLFRWNVTSHFLNMLRADAMVNLWNVVRIAMSSLNFVSFCLDNWKSWIRSWRWRTGAVPRKYTFTDCCCKYRRLWRAKHARQIQ